MLSTCSLPRLLRACARSLALAVAVPVLVARKRGELAHVAEPHLQALVGEEHEGADEHPLPSARMLACFPVELALACFSAELMLAGLLLCRARAGVLLRRARAGVLLGAQCASLNSLAITA